MRQLYSLNPNSYPHQDAPLFPTSMPILTLTPTSTLTSTPTATATPTPTFTLTNAPMPSPTVAPPTSTPTPSPFPHPYVTPFVIANYFPWYDPEDWTGGCVSDTPLEPYNSDDSQAIARHISKAQRAGLDGGLDGFAVHWFAPGDRTDTNLSQVLSRSPANFHSANPGCEDLRVSSQPFARDRENGEYYQRTVGAVLPTQPDFIIIIVHSFNEWVEGSTIEPSASYGDLYLELTARHVAAFRALP